MSKKMNVEKQLVRNSEVPVRAVGVSEKSTKLKKVHFVEVESPTDASSEAHAGLDNPEFLTVLQLANEVNKIRNSQCTIHSHPEGTKFRNLNFTPDEKVYQNLIELEDLPEKLFKRKTKSQCSVRNTLKKDAEPDYQNLLKYTLEPAYMFSSQALPAVRKHNPVFDGLSLYSKVKMWKEEGETI